MSHKNKIKEFLKSKSNRLDVSGCKLTEIPKELQKNLDKHALQIIELEIGFNLFTKLDLKELSADFNALNTLNCSGNSSMVSFQLGRDFKALQELNLSGCKLSSLGENSFSGLVNLRRLNLANNQLDIIHVNLFQPVKANIEEVNLSGNSHLSKIPPSLVECKSLEILDLSGCGLRSPLPLGFGDGLCNLLELNLGNNMISFLPNSVGKMKRLCLLNIQDNDLNSLPISIGHCVALGATGSTGGGINIYGNPLQDDFDLKLKVSQGPCAIMDYLEKRMSLHKGPVSLNDSGSVSPISVGVGSPDYASVAGPRPISPPNQHQQQQSLPNRPPSYTSAVPVKDKLTELLSGEIKRKIQKEYELITKSQTAEEMIPLGNKMTVVQEDIDKLVNSLKIQKEFNFISPKPMPNEEKLVQIKKVLHLKLEKLVLYIKHLLEYITLHCLAQNFKSVSDFDQIILFIYDSIQKLNNRWII